MHLRTQHTSDQEKPASPRVPVSPDRSSGGPPVAPPLMTPTELLEFQGTVGNRVATGALQRSPEDGDDTEPTEEAPTEDPRAALTRSLIGSTGRGPVTNHKIREVLERRLKTGPPFDAGQLAAIRDCDQDWLDVVGIGRYQDAQDYVDKGNYRTWSARKLARWPRIKPGQRILIATIAWTSFRAEPDKHKLPSYTLGRALRIRSPYGLAAQELAAITAERDQQIRDAFVDTLIPAEAPEGGTEAEAGKVQRAQDILTRVFLILQNGLKVYREGTYVDYEEGDVARAMAHGGRVNIRIPALRPENTAFDLLDWFGLTSGGKDANPSERRSIGSHSMDIGKNRGEVPGKFKEKGGTLVGLSNALKYGLSEKARLPVDDSRTYGINPAAGGWGNLDVNDDVIKPDGGHGHMFLRFQPPTQDRDGVLQIGMETTAPGASSPVGYQHDLWSTEATANPESSFFGHKQDRVGEGKLNQRIVNLAEFGGESGPWLEFLQELEEYWKTLLAAAGDDPARVRELYERLVGPREGRFRPPSGEGPTAEQSGTSE